MISMANTQSRFVPGADYVVKPAVATHEAGRKPEEGWRTWRMRNGFAITIEGMEQLGRSR